MKAAACSWYDSQTRQFSASSSNLRFILDKLQCIVFKWHSKKKIFRIQHNRIQKWCSFIPISFFFYYLESGLRNYAKWGFSDYSRTCTLNTCGRHLLMSWPNSLFARLEPYLTSFSLALMSHWEPMKIRYGSKRVSRLLDPDVMKHCFVSMATSRKLLSR